MSAIIHSLLDTDLYKFTMLQVVLHKFPQTHSVYHFRCRNLEDTVYPLTDILDDLNEQLDYLCQLKFKEDELLYLRSLRFIKSDFVDYLELFQLERRFIKASIDSATPFWPVNGVRLLPELHQYGYGGNTIH